MMEGMEIKTKTKKGAKTILSIKNGKIKVKIPTPTGMVALTPTGWGKRGGEEGVVGSLFYKGKNCVACVTIPRKDWDKAETTAKEQGEDLTAKAMALKIIGFEYIVGCDASSQYRFLYEDNNIPFDFQYKRMEADEPLIEAIKRLPLRDLAASWKTETLEATLSSYGGYRFTSDETHKLIALATTQQEREREEKEKALAAEKEREQAIFEKAKKTGEPQILDIWITEECTTGEYDCSFDSATLYALPNGKTKTVYQHCY